MYTKKELLKKIKFRRNFLNVAYLISVLFLIAFVVSFMTFQNTLLVFILSGVIVILTAGLFKIIFDRNVKEKWNEEEICSQILMTGMTEKFGKVDIAVEESINEDIVKLSGFKFTEKYDEYIGKNYISAYHNNVHIEFCQAEFGNLRTIHETADENNPGGTYQVLDDIFNGTFYICHMSGSFYPVTITDDKSNKTSSMFKTGNALFDKIFSVHSKYSDTSNITLTENICDFFIKAANKTKKNIFVYFSSDGNIYIAFDGIIYNEQYNDGKKAFAVIENQLEIISDLIDGIYTRALLRI